MLRELGEALFQDHVTLWTGRLRRCLHRRAHRRLAREISRSLDLRAIARLAERLPACGDFAKFTRDFEEWLLEAVRRFDQYDLLKVPELGRLLDIGCGAGQALLVAEHLGYTATGLDVPKEEEEGFTEILDVLGLERVDHRIEPFVPLPGLGGSYDVVTIFMTSFNKLPDGTPWHSAHWRFFLSDLHRHLRPEGRVIVKFNVNRMIGRHYPADVWELVSGWDLYQSARFRDSWILRMVEDGALRLPAPVAGGDGGDEGEEQPQVALPSGGLGV